MKNENYYLLIAKYVLKWEEICSACNGNTCAEHLTTSEWHKYIKSQGVCGKGNVSNEDTSSHNSADRTRSEHHRCELCSALFPNMNELIEHIYVKEEDCVKNPESSDEPAEPAV